MSTLGSPPSSPSTAVVVPSPPKVPPPRPPPGVPKSKTSIFSRSTVQPKSDVHPSPGGTTGSGNSPPSSSPTRQTVKKLISIVRGNGGNTNTNSSSPHMDNSYTSSFDVQPLSPLPTSGSGKKFPTVSGAKIRPAEIINYSESGRFPQSEYEARIATSNGDKASSFDVIVYPSSPGKNSLSPTRKVEQSPDDWTTPTSSPSKVIPNLPVEDDVMIQLETLLTVTTIGLPPTTSPSPMREHVLPQSSPRMDNISPFSSSKLPAVPKPTSPSKVQASNNGNNSVLMKDLASAAQKVVLTRTAASGERKKGEDNVEASLPTSGSTKQQENLLLVTPMVTAETKKSMTGNHASSSARLSNTKSRTSSFELRTSYQKVTKTSSSQTPLPKSADNQPVHVMSTANFDAPTNSDDKPSTRTVPSSTSSPASKTLHSVKSSPSLTTTSTAKSSSPFKANRPSNNRSRTASMESAKSTYSSSSSSPFKKSSTSPFFKRKASTESQRTLRSEDGLSSRKTSTETESIASSTLSASLSSLKKEASLLPQQHEEYKRGGRKISTESQLTLSSYKSPHGSLEVSEDHLQEFKEEEEEDIEQQHHAALSRNVIDKAARTFLVPLPPPPPPPSMYVKQQLQRTRQQYTLDDFELGVTLGTGSFGRVRFARFREPIPNSSECDVPSLAIKILRKDCVKRLNQVQHIKHEKQILEALITSKAQQDGSSAQFPWMPKTRHHPFIVQLFGTFQTETCLFMVMEFIRGGEFFCHLRMRGHFKNKEAMFYTASVASAFAFLHKQDVAYRDLKPENLMLDHEGYLKVVDFGFAKRIPDNKTYTLCGTPEYIAPEVLLNQGHGKGVDWWALGILTYEMLSGVAPFTDADPMVIYQKIVRGNVMYPTYFDPDARSFLRRLLQTDLSKRYGCLAAGARDVMEHRWLGGIDFEKLLKRQAIPPVVPVTKDAEDTSCFEEYPDSEEIDLQGIDGEPYQGGGEFPDFDVVCL